MKVDLVKRAMEKIRKRPVNYRYFFAHLDSPEWIGPLLEEGMFQHPPEPVRTGDYRSFPSWPESEYLARMAGKTRAAAEAVLDIALKVHTENINVHGDFSDAALKMPPDLAAKWAVAEAKWISAQGHLIWSLPDKFGKLIVHLASGGQMRSALYLANALLGSKPSADDENEEDQSSLIGSGQQPRVRLDHWHYEEIIKTYITQASDVAGMPILRMLCQLLSDSLRIEYGHTESDMDVDDYSYIWRKYIDDDSNHHYDEVRNPLISAIRNIGNGLVRNGTATQKQVIAELDACKWMVCRRLAMHFLGVWDNPHPELVSHYLTDESLFRTVDVEREYALLLKERFGMLPEAHQETILGWIAQGPDHGKKTEEAVGRWQRDWLSLIVSHLPDEQKAKHDELVLALGPAAMPNSRGFTHGSWVGPTSPVGTNELVAMSVHEIINYLKTWVPTGYPTDPSPEGLGRALSVAVAADPFHFAESAGSFAVLQEPTYISSLFSGFQQAVKQARAFPWSPVLDLAVDIVGRPRDIPGRNRQEDHDRDPHWGWSRQEIGRLLRDAFSLKKGGISLRLRSRVWSILEVLMDDPDPTPEHEAAYGGSNQDPANMSLNTVRGTAMHAVICYALWLRRSMERKKNKNELIANGFDEMPEVREILDNHLDTTLDPALTIRAVYGWWFTQLVLLDPMWARANAGKIFPVDESQRQYWQAAWASYLLFDNLYGSVYDALVEQYSIAIARSCAVTGKDGKPSESDERLGQHLVTIYRWGRIGLDEMMRFFSVADPRLRADAISYAGQSLQAESSCISGERLRSLENLWVNRLDAAKSMSAEERRTELSAFGWWAISGKFHEDWVMEMFGKTLSLAGWAEPDDDVIKWLADLAPRMPGFAVECLAIMADGDQQGWEISYSWQNELRSIVTTALSSKDSKAKQRATDLVNRLCARGLLQYRDLLDPANRD